MNVTVAIGSNIDPAEHMPQAVEELAQEFGILECSPAIQTGPIDRPDQADYWNAVVRFDTDLDEVSLHELLRSLEANHGRARSTDKWAARTLDLDIIQFDDEPGDDLRERDFLAALVANLDGERLEGWNVVWHP